MRKQLSTRLTIVYKFLLLLSCIPVLVYVALARSVPPTEIATVALVAMLLLAPWTLPLKRVIATNDGLLVSNFFQEVAIPYSWVSEVRENKWIRHRLITITLAESEHFGRKIRFMPYFDLGVTFPWKDHPAYLFLQSQTGVPRPR